MVVDLSPLLEEERLTTMLHFPCDVERLPNGNTLIADAGDEESRGSKVLEVDPGGHIVWWFADGLRFAHGAKRLPDGNTLIADTNNDRVIMVTPSGEIAFTTDSWGKGTGRLSDGSHLRYPNDAHLLVDGSLVITDRNNDRCVIVDRRGTVLWSYDHQITHPHNCDVLPNGNVLMADSDGRRVLEVDRAKRPVWSYGDGSPETLNWPRDADRLPNGNTLITDSKNSRVLEVTPAGEVVWSYGVDHFANFYEADGLPNGNVLISDQQHKRVLEVSRSGEVVWEYRNYRPARSPNPRLVNGSFRERDPRGLPAGWTLVTRLAEGGGRLVWDAGADPRPCPGLEYDRHGALYLMQMVAVEPGVRYTLTGELRTRDLRDGVAYLQLGWVDAYAGYMADAATLPHGRLLSGDNDWTRETVVAVAPSGAVSVEARVVISGPGHVWARGLMLFC